MSCAYTQENLLQEAYDKLNSVIALGQGLIIDEIYILHAHLCIKLHSTTISLYSQALLDYNYLIQQHPEDMNFVNFFSFLKNLIFIILYIYILNINRYYNVEQYIVYYKNMIVQLLILIIFYIINHH